MEGKAKTEYSHVDGKPTKEQRTCPEYYARQLAFEGVYELISDYKKGALGNVRLLPYPLFSALRILEAEQDEQERRLNEL